MMSIGSVTHVYEFFWGTLMVTCQHKEQHFTTLVNLFQMYESS